MASDQGDGNHNFSERARRIFSESKPLIVEDLLSEFRRYREACPAEVVRADLRRIVTLAAQGRAAIARQSGDPAAADFLTFRLGGENEFAVTDLLNGSYDLMRTCVQARIRNFLKSKDHGSWVGNEQTRMRLRIQPPNRFPVTIEAQKLEAYGDRCANIAHVTQAERGLIDAGLNFNYAQQMIMGGCCANYLDGAASYSLPLKLLLKKRAMTEHTDFNLSWAVPQILDQDDFSLPEGKRLINAPRFNVKDSRFVWVDIEHNPDGKGFIPGYGFLALLPGNLCDQTGDFPLMIMHPAKVYLPCFVEQYENFLHQALVTNLTKRDQIIRLIGTFHYHWAKTMPMERGSAANGEFLTEALFKLHGYKNVRFDPTIFTSVDNGAFMHWTEAQFLEKYTQAINLNKIVKKKKKKNNKTKAAAMNAAQAGDNGNDDKGKEEAE